MSAQFKRKCFNDVGLSYLLTNYRLFSKVMVLAITVQRRNRCRPFSSINKSTFPGTNDIRYYRPYAVINRNYRNEIAPNAHKLTNLILSIYINIFFSIAIFIIDILIMKFSIITLNFSFYIHKKK